MVGGAQLFNLGQQRAAVRRQDHTAPVAAQQGDAQLVLQGLNGMTDAGLGKVHGLRRLGEIAAGHGFQKDLIFGYAHVSTSLLIGFYHTFTHGCKYNDAFYKYKMLCYDRGNSENGGNHNGIGNQYDPLRRLRQQ